MTGPGGSGPTRGRRRGGCGVRLMMLLVVVAAAGSLAWMTLLPVMFVRTVRERTGFDPKITSLSANPFTGRVSLRGLVIANPPEFPTSDFLQVRSFEAAVDGWSIFGERLLIDSLALDVRQLVLVRGARGPSNFELFRSKLEGPAPANTKSPVEIRRLHLRLDTLVLADHGGTAPRVRTYALGLDRKFVNISALNQLLAPEFLRGLVEPEAASGLGPFLPPDLRAPRDKAPPTGTGPRQTR